VLGLVFLISAARIMSRQIKRLDNDVDDRKEPERSSVLYGRYLVGLGFALLLTALTSSMVFAGVAWSVGHARAGQELGQADGGLQGDAWDGNNAIVESGASEALPERFGALFGNTPAEAYFTVALFALSTMVALLGALFFFATALWNKMQEAQREPFDRRVFWAGLWFRLGEAVLFNLVFFLLLRYYAPESYLFLPLVSLLVGMFLKAGETLISGIATRIFAAFEALVPATMKLPTILKLFTLSLTGLPADAQARAAKMTELAEAIRGLAGVAQVDADPQASTLRVQYDVDKVSRERIAQEVQLRGLSIVPVAAAVNGGSRDH
jgi:hypothetical protein